MNIQYLYIKNKRLIFSIIIFCVFLLIVAFIKPGSAAALGRTDTGSQCYTQASIASKGIMADGNPFVSIQYGVIGDQYARSFDYFGQYREPGSHIRSDQCTPRGWTFAWWPGGNHIDPSSAGYETALNGIAGTSGYTVSKVYLGIPSNQSGNAGYNAGSTGNNYAQPGIGANDGKCFAGQPCAGSYGRSFYGITNCLGATCNNNADVYGIVNDGGLAQINGTAVWCVGYDTTPICRGDVSSVYVGGGDFAGYLMNQNFSSSVGGSLTAGLQNYNPLNNLNNINKDLNTGNTYQYDVQNSNPIETGNGAFDFVQYGVNTRDRLTSGLSWDTSTCLNYAPYDGSCTSGKCSSINPSDCVPAAYPSEAAGDQSEDAATIFTYELQAPPEVFTCNSSSINPNPVFLNSNESFTVNVGATPVGATGTATVSVTYPDGSIHTYSIPSVGGTGNQLSGTSGVFSLSSVGSYSYSWSFSPNPVPGYVITNNAVNCPGTTFTVLAAPYLSVTGGDVVAGSNINVTSSCSAANLSTPINSGILSWNNKATGASNLGSGTTMAAQALAAISGFASDQGSPPNAYNHLSFANDTSTTTHPNIDGQFGDSPCTPTFAAQTPNKTYSTPLNNLSVSPGMNSYNGSIVISDLNIPVGQKSTIYVNGNVSITGDIKYDTTGWSINSSTNTIPSLKVIATGDIVIDPQVKQLDGVYETTKDIYDCSTHPFASIGKYQNTGPATNPCYANNLTVNGSFIANRIFFQRTGGNAFSPVGPTNQAAETFNYGPEDWLSSPDSSTGAFSSFQQLPPVF